jgi:hypothetical protein
VRGAVHVRRPTLAARDVDAGGQLQTFLVSAVFALLATRLFLNLTGYPRIGGAGLHIAHLLWGGLLMLIAQVMLLSVLGKQAKRWAAVVGGLGFGLFVDELGKFLTADNNYFFQPTIALIYVLFVALFLAFKAIERRSLSSDELLVNSADMLRELVQGGATRAEVVRARRLLDRSGAAGPLADELREAIDASTRVPERRSLIASAAAFAWHSYDRLLKSWWFHHAITIVFVMQAVIGLLFAIVVGWGVMQDTVPPVREWALLTSVVTLSMSLIGVARLRRSRLGAYRWFERGLLVSIFITQVIIFWVDQLGGLDGLIWDLALLAILRYLIRQEEARQ